MKVKEFEDFMVSYSHVQVCSFDAGGGNALAHLIHEMGLKTRFAIDGPSFAIYSALFPKFSTQNSDGLYPDTDLFDFKHWMAIVARIRNYGRGTNKRDSGSGCTRSLGELQRKI